MGDTINEVSEIREVRELTDVEVAANTLHLTIGLSAIVELELVNGETLNLDPNDARAPVWRQFLNWQQQAALPVFVAADESRLVRELLPASKRRVEKVEPLPVEGRLRVLFRASPAIFYLNPALPRFTELRTRLEDAAHNRASLRVTHHPLTYEILDVREAPSEEVAGSLPASLTISDTAALVETEVTLERAFQVFKVLADSDIPFKHIKDCCTGRAQKMCRLMLEDHNIRARKIWNYGSGFSINKGTLCIKTSSDPSGKVCWRYHVAPIVNVVDGLVKTLVFDPSLFSEPVPITSWLLIQNDKDATQEFTDEDIFENVPNSPDDWPDPGAAEVDKKLAAHSGESIVLNAYRALFFEPPL